MRLAIGTLVFLSAAFLFPRYAQAQAAGDVCGDTAGSTVWLSSKVVYGTVKLIGADRLSKPPKMSVILMLGTRTTTTPVAENSGNYCFRDTDGSGATLIVEVDGREVGREVLETVSSTSPKQFRRDFDIQIGPSQPRKPAVISAKFPYSRNDRNSKLYAGAVAALDAKDYDTSERTLKKIVETDKDDFWAWAKLGAAQMEKNDLANAEKSFRHSLDLKSDFVPAMVSLGRVYLLQKQFDQAIEIFLSATKSDPTAARAFQLLGESYLMVRKGTLGVAALDEAIRLEPVAMAECHLLKARLYDRAGAKSYASREYKIFLEKVPNHPEAKTFSKYIQDNPAEP